MRCVVASGICLMAAACADGREAAMEGEGACTVVVRTAAGLVRVDVEREYLPRVVQCENGAADQAALEAQAIAARSYLYHRLATGDGTIDDSQRDQVFSCGREPGPEHVAAVNATSGLVLRYGDTRVAGFYVAGALPRARSCVGGANDPTGTEMWVTYNDGKSGDDVTQTPLGFLDPANHANRGCMSQNGADCLAEHGRDAASILRFYYGADILLEPVGECVEVEIEVEERGGCSRTATAGALGLAAAALLFWRRPARRRRS